VPLLPHKRRHLSHCTRCTAAVLIVRISHEAAGISVVFRPSPPSFFNRAQNAIRRLSDLKIPWSAMQRWKRWRRDIIVRGETRSP
jgi:hypothetical protein